MRANLIRNSQHLQHLPGQRMPPHFPFLLLQYITTANIPRYNDDRDGTFEDSATTNSPQSRVQICSQDRAPYRSAKTHLTRVAVSEPGDEDAASIC